MADAQQGRCAICRQEAPLVTDHNHVDGRVRDLLCTACNRGLGFMQENEEILAAAIAYLRRHRIRSA